MVNYTIKALGPDTWDAYAALAEKHNGVWGGCWCTWFHRVPGEKGHGVPTEVRAAGEPGEHGALLTRRWKEHLVLTGHAHAAVVFDGDTAIGWCQYGTPEELPNIYHRKEHDAEPEKPPARYRITCFFVDRDYRRHGVAGIALQGALDLIAAAGGGVVESFPNDTQGKKTSASFLHNATRSLFERAGFRFERTMGTKKTLMRKTVRARRSA